MSEQIVAFFREPRNAEQLDRLLTQLELIAPEVRGADAVAGGAPLEGLRFVFTGGLEGLSRNEAKTRVESLGGRVTSSVSKSTDFVVVGADPGSKADKAQDLGIEMLDEEAFLQLLRDKGA